MVSPVMNEHYTGASYSNHYPSTKTEVCRIHSRIDSVDGFTGSQVSAEASVALEEERVASGGTLDDLGQVQSPSFASFEFLSLFFAQELEALIGFYDLGLNELLYFDK